MPAFYRRQYFRNHGLFLIFFGVSVMLGAQSRLHYIDLAASLSQPTGFFARKVPTTRWGGHLGYLSQWSSGSPLFVGGELSYYTLGHGKARLLEFIDFQELLFDYETTSHVLVFGPRCRFYPGVHAHRFDVFLEAFAGWNWLFTHTRATLVEDDEVSDGFLEKGSIAFSYGAGVGCHYDLSASIFIQTRFQYRPGLSASYYIRQKEAQATVSSLDLFTLTSSPTNTWRWDIGIFIKLETEEE